MSMFRKRRKMKKQHSSHPIACMKTKELKQTVIAFVRTGFFTTFIQLDVFLAR